MSEENFQEQWMVNPNSDSWSSLDGNGALIVPLQLQGGAVLHAPRLIMTGVSKGNAGWTMQHDDFIQNTTINKRKVQLSESAHVR